MSYAAVYVWCVVVSKNKNKKTVIKTVTRTNILQQTVTNILTVSRSIFVFFTVFLNFGLCTIYVYMLMTF